MGDADSSDDEVDSDAGKRDEEILTGTIGVKEEVQEVLGA